VPGIRDPYTLVFDQQELEVVLQGLGKLPAERSYNLLTRLGNEIAQENQRRQAPPADSQGVGSADLVGVPVQ
jgi:hypothetical protein